MNLSTPFAQHLNRKVTPEQTIQDVALQTLRTENFQVFALITQVESDRKTIPILP